VMWYLPLSEFLKEFKSTILIGHIVSFPQPLQSEGSSAAIPFGASE
jgi:hypothetical protein